MVLVDECVLILTDSTYPVLLLGPVLFIYHRLLLPTVNADGPQTPLTLMLDSDHIEALRADLTVFLLAPHIIDEEGFEDFVVVVGFV